MGVAEIVTGDGVTALSTGLPIEDGDALVVATSGSGGESKGVVLTHAAVAASASATSKRLEVSSADHWLACLPLAHVGGLSVITRALHTGTRLTVHDGFDPDAVDASDATLVSLVATALRRIDATRFRTIVLGGSRPPAERPGERGHDLRHDGDRQRRGLRPAPARRRRDAHRRRRAAPAMPDAAALLPRRHRPAHRRPDGSPPATSPTSTTTDC